MPPESAILTAVLAATDAVWMPFRWRGGVSAKAASAVSERRSEFGDRGVPFVAGGSVTQRKASERELQEAADAGLLRIHYGGKRVGVSFTDRGDDVARALTGGYTARESFPLLAQVTRAAKAIGDDNGGFQWEGECVHPRVRDYQRPTEAEADRIRMFSLRALPLLARGWLESASDPTGVVGYQVTAAGCAAKRPKTGVLPEFEQACGDAYYEAFLAVLNDRESWEPRVRVVEISLSAGMWPERATR